MRRCPSIGQNKYSVSGLRAHRLRPARRRFKFCYECPITAKIAGSIGILPCCALNNFFTEGYERLPDFEADRWPEKLLGPKDGHGAATKLNTQTDYEQGRIMQPSLNVSWGQFWMMPEMEKVWHVPVSHSTMNT